MEEFRKLEERVVLVGVQTDDHDNVEESLDELKELASTAGAVTVGRIIQNRESVHPGTYIGKGKIEEVRALVYAMDATGIICDDELSPAQLNNLERELDCKVMDRTLLILDIFAARAITSEGKIQVELAQLRYRSARLVGLRESLSRLGGGIGTRGPGEKKLETHFAGTSSSAWLKVFVFSDHLLIFFAFPVFNLISYFVLAQYLAKNRLCMINFTQSRS